MDNKQFELVTLHNPLDEPFPITYNKEVVRTIPPHSDMQLVRMWADNGKKHLVDRLMRRDGHNLLDKDKRAEYEQKVVVSEEGSLLSATPSQNELANQLIAKSEAAKDPTNDHGQWKFDPLTGAPITPSIAPQSPIAPQPDMPKQPPSFSNPEVASVMGGIGQGGTGSLPAQVIDDAPAELPDTTQRVVTRDQLLGWARANLPINLDDPETSSRIGGMTDDELRKEFRYDELAA